MQRNERLEQPLESFDDDHRGIEDLLDRLSDSVARHDSEAAGLLVLSEMVEYSILHVEREERSMLLAKCDRFAEHAADHDRIFYQITCALADWERLGEVGWNELSHSLRKAYHHHFLEFDRHFCEIAGDHRR